MRPRLKELSEIVLPLLEPLPDVPPRKNTAAEVERRSAEALSWLERAEDDRWSFKKLGLATPDDSELHITSSHALERAARLFSETPDPTGAIEDLYNGFVELNVRSYVPFADDIEDAWSLIGSSITSSPAFRCSSSWTRSRTSALSAPTAYSKFASPSRNYAHISMRRKSPARVSAAPSSACS